MNQYYAEATFHVPGSKDEYDYVYVTYDKGKLKGNQINKMGSYNILARARIPIDKNAFVDMRLFTEKDDRIIEFTMQYRDLVNYNGVLGRLNIRSDYGHGTKDPHIDIELLDQTGKKKALNKNGNVILDEKVPQPTSFLKYEAAINAVLMQVEKYDPKIGAKYWLSPFGVHDARVNTLLGLKNQFGISTSLSILARVMTLKLYDETMQESEADMNRFKEIAYAQLRLCKEKERQYAGALDVSEIKYSTEMSVLPFVIFIPEKAYHDFKRYSCGTEIQIEPVTVVSELKAGREITRPPTLEETKALSKTVTKI